MKASRSSSTATTCRRSCSAPANPTQELVLLHGERADTWRRRVGNYKAVFNLRGDDGATTGGLAVDTNLGWKGAESYVATVPQVFDLWQDPQERYDIFMNNYTEHTWTMVTITTAIKELMQTYVKYPPRKLQSESTPAQSPSRTISGSNGSRATREGRRQHRPAHG